MSKTVNDISPIIAETSLDLLQWSEVLVSITSFCTWTGGREHLEGERPVADLEQRLRSRRDIELLVEWCKKGGHLSFEEMDSLEEYLTLVGKGKVLTVEQAFEVYRTLRVLTSLLEGSKEDSELANWESEQELFVEIHSWKELNAPKSRFAHAISGDEPEMLDRASGELRDIRKGLRQAESSLENQAKRVLRTKRLQPMVQEMVVTQREGRVVVPVKAEFKGEFPGTVIDQSATGATLFMEPHSVTELSNRVRQLKLSERQEIYRILQKLSHFLQDFVPQMSRFITRAAYIDRCYALARYQEEDQLAFVTVGETAGWNLKQLRHPLLEDRCVPINILLEKEHLGFVISGPNAGGKTVALKTLALNLVATYCGWPCWCEGGSWGQNLRKIWIDIGDHQSLEEDLSTYTAFLTRMRHLLKRGGQGWLAILDELGTGTDPKEGGALARAMLERCWQQEILVVATTHLESLKDLTLSDERCQGAAVKLKPHDLSPDYRLHVGELGRSHALDIASRTGIPQEVLESAKNYLGEDHLYAQDLIEELEHKVKGLEGHKEELKEQKESLQAKMEQLHDQLFRSKQSQKDRLGHLEEQQKRMEQSLQDKARSAIRGRYKEIRDELQQRISRGYQILQKKPRSAKEWESTFRSLIREWEEGLSGRFDQESRKKEVQSTLSKISHRKDKISKEQKKIEQKQTEEFLQWERQRQEKKERETTIEVGSLVRWSKGNQKGEVLRIKGKQARVAFGVLKMEVPLAELQLATQGVERKRTQLNLPSSGKENLKSSLDLRGLTLDESIHETSLYLDQVSRHSMGSVQLIHGKGTGALRLGLHRWLKKQSLVRTYRLGEPHEGGYGVTVVVLGHE